jgi:hypothetical protein
MLGEFCFQDDNGKTIIGMSHQNPERTYQLVKQLDAIGNSYYRSGRDSVFLVDNAANTFQFYHTDSHRQNAAYDNNYAEKRDYFVERSLKFRILKPDCRYIVIMDVPFSPQIDNVGYHNDRMSVQRIIDSFAGLDIRQMADYIIIENRNEYECVTTTVELEMDGENKQFRTIGCLGTQLCIENTGRKHSAPAIIGGDVRKQADLILNEVYHSKKPRSVYRIRIKELTEAEHDYLLNLNAEVPSETIHYGEIGIPFNPLPLYDKYSDIQHYIKGGVKKPTRRRHFKRKKRRTHAKR